MKKILAAYENSADAYASGITVNGEKYTVIQIQENTIRTKKVSLT